MLQCNQRPTVEFANYMKSELIRQSMPCISFTSEDGGQKAEQVYVAQVLHDE